MKYLMSCLSMVLLSAGLWAQTPAPPAQPAQPMRHGMHPGMSAMHQQHMQEMKAQVAKMRATLDQMKAAIAAEKGDKENQIEKQNVELWEAMISHLEGMVNMMSQQGGPPMGMMHGGMGGCCAGMSGCCGGMKDGASCCGGMKDGGGCCGGNKCMPPASPEKPSSPSM